MTALTDIIARLEKATGPDLDLDHAIAATVSPADGHGVLLYTAFIDAAVTLVPEGYRWLVGNAWKDKHGSCPTMASVCLAEDYGNKPATGATPAIALCIAALKAHKSAADRESATSVRET